MSPPLDQVQRTLPLPTTDVWFRELDTRGRSRPLDSNLGSELFYVRPAPASVIFRKRRFRTLGYIVGKLGWEKGSMEIPYLAHFPLM